MRLVGSALIIIAGVLALGFGDLAFKHTSVTYWIQSHKAGWPLVVLGTALFVVEYVRQWVAQRSTGGK